MSFEQPQDKTEEISGLLDKFAELMTSISQNYSTMKTFETLINLQNKTDNGLVKTQYETAKVNQESMRQSLDMIANELRARGQGFAIEGYEDKLSILK